MWLHRAHLLIKKAVFSITIEKKIQDVFSEARLTIIIGAMNYYYGHVPQINCLEVSILITFMDFISI